MSRILGESQEILYPESDGKPLGENTLQFQWIFCLMHGFENLFIHRDDVFVAADLFWYPVQGEPKIATAPDIMVAFGRPKGYRGSYRQWEEDGIAPQVVIEIRSPSNTDRDIEALAEFYERHGVEEFYLYDPQNGTLEIRVRSKRRLVRILKPSGFVSPRLEVRFDLEEQEALRVVRPNGREFPTYYEAITEADEERARADEAIIEANEERARADEAITEANEERARAEEADARAEMLAAKLRELGIDPDTFQPRNK